MTVHQREHVFRSQKAPHTVPPAKPRPDHVTKQEHLDPHPGPLQISGSGPLNGGVLRIRGCRCARTGARTFQVGVKEQGCPCLRGKEMEFVPPSRFMTKTGSSLSTVPSARRAGPVPLMRDPPRSLSAEGRARHPNRSGSADTDAPTRRPSLRGRRGFGGTNQGTCIHSGITHGPDDRVVKAWGGGRGGGERSMGGGDICDTAHNKDSKI